MYLFANTAQASEPVLNPNTKHAQLNFCLVWAHKMMFTTNAVGEIG